MAIHSAGSQDRINRGRFPIRLRVCLFFLSGLAAVSAFQPSALGEVLGPAPYIGYVPDVYIGSQSQDGQPPETYANLFRYTDALLPWDYVMPGVTSGDGSTSDTLYWTWAARKADWNGGLGDFLDPALAATHPDGFVYSIIQENAVVVDPIQPTAAEGSAAWTDEINSALTALGPDLPGQSLAAAGALTFRNIRLSPPPDQDYPAPTPNTGIPQGYLDIQEATLYVSDTVTTPDLDRILVVTVAGDSPDFLSRSVIPPPPIDDWRHNTIGFGAFLSRGNSINVALPVTIDPPGVTFTNSGKSLAVTVPATNPTGTYHLALVSQSALGGTPADPNRLYRLTSTLSSSNAVAQNNPGVLVALNGRSTGSGWGFSQFVDGYIAGPQVGIDVDLYGYVWPVAAIPVPAQLWILDQGTGGGTITFSELMVERIYPPALENPVVLCAETMFTRTDDPDSGWSYFDSPYPGMTNAVWSAAPPKNTSGAELVISANTAGSISLQGFAEFGRNNVYSPTPGKIVVLEFAVTSSAQADATPDIWISTASAAFTASLIWNRLDFPSTGPTSTVSPYSVVFEAPSAGPFSVYFRAMAERPATNGDIRLHELTVTEYDPPPRFY